MTTYEKIVKGATKVKVAAPKPKYIEPILMSTSIDHAVAAENFHTVMRALQTRLQDSAWSVVYKSLIVIHIMIREGDRDVTLKFLSSKAPGMLNLSESNISKNHNFNSDVRFIIKYSKYLHTRVRQFGETNIDYVRDERSNNSTSQAGGRLRTLSVDKGLLRESESVQKQIDALLKNNFTENEVSNDVILTAFRLLVNDLLALFQELNEGVINLLEHYFEMSKYDAERALKIYKKFVDQTKYVIDYLRVAKHLEYATKLHVPTIKHAPTALTSSLEEYLDDPNFEVNRKQYLAEKRNKKSAGDTPSQNGSYTGVERSASKSTSSPAPLAPPAANNQAAEEAQRRASLVVQQSTFNPWANSVGQFSPGGPSNNVFAAPNQGFQLAAIPQGQILGQPTQQQQPQQQQIPQQVQQINPVYTGAGFGGYGPQSTGQVQAQATGNNPFLQQMPTTPQQQQPQPIQQQFTSQPFQQQFTHQPLQQQFTQPLPQQYHQPQQFQPQQQQPLQAQNTAPINTMGLSRSNTNPFAKLTSSLTGNQISTNSTNPFANTRFSGGNTTALTFDHERQQQQQQQSNDVQPINPTTTGNNPFKVSQNTTNLFNNVQQQQQRQQQALKPQPTAGGLENLPTVPVFPQTQEEQQRNAYINQAKVGLQQQATGYNFQQQQQPPQQQFQQPQFQQQQAPMQQPIFTNSVYEGPSLI